MKRLNAPASIASRTAISLLLVGQIALLVEFRLKAPLAERRIADRVSGEPIAVIDG
ncbi:hypothetical protein ABZ860_37475 [Microbispora sp. NPDC046973]|uniref:hypothetical protein n=1 Tax=Microbispora sp. NPDC046973 TaxID=3155022 RepID=UPI0033FD9E8D